MAFVLSIVGRDGKLVFDDGRGWTHTKNKAKTYDTAAAAKRRAQLLANRDRVQVSVARLVDRNPSKKRRRKRIKAKRNPSARDAVDQAAKLYSDFRGEEPHEVIEVRMPKRPQALLTVGECMGIMYRTRRDGVTENYCHEFRKKSRPTLVVSSDGKNLYLLGGAYRVTDRGIEDA